MNIKLQKAEEQVALAKSDFETAISENNINLFFQKEAAFAMQLFQANDFLAGMNPDSIRNAIINVALTGLTLNPVMKFAYLVPRKGKCCLDPSYMGLIKILTDTGSVKNIEANVVYANEPFQLERGTNPFIKHGLSPTSDRGDIIGFYSVATLNDGTVSIEWMYKSEVDNIAMRSEATKKAIEQNRTNSVWHTDYTEMGRKTVVKRHYKYLPKSDRAIQIATAIDLDNEVNGIDFDAEKHQNKKTDTINIDVVDPNNAQEINDYEAMLQQGIPQSCVPLSMFGGQSKEDFVTDFRNDMMSGRLSREKAQSVYQKVSACFQQQPQQ